MAAIEEIKKEPGMFLLSSSLEEEQEGRGEMREG
jgi:hypothetical protein